jgi:GNAT superfamily N-acetyltransferase
MAGGLIDRITGADLRIALRQRFADLEGGGDRALAVAGGLMRYATALHMVRGMLPTGRSVTYQAAEGEEIPALPVRDELEPESAITASTDAIAEEGAAESGRGVLTVPFVSAARRFYLPQWVAFDDAGQLLVNSVSQAQAHVASMQRYVGILHAAVALAPYVVVDEEYQRKRYGMLGQLVNQARALARYQTQEIIITIKRRAAASDLNRGLSLSLPYFDDQRLEVRHFDFEIIPAGRIMFVPAFVVRASREEQGKVAQDTRLSPSTRKYLLAELKALEEAFASAAPGTG